MIQDIEPHHFKNEYEPEAPDKDSIILCYKGREVLAKSEGGKLVYPTFGEMEKYNDGLYENYNYLFSIDSQRFYLADDISCGPLSSYHMENSQILRRAEPKYLAFAGATGWQLYNWYKSRRFCGKCGKPMIPDEKERMMKCSKCGHMEYPKICPAVIVAVTHGNRLLMSKYAGREYKKYALLAGFAEIGETIEDTVRREVMEEVGLKVKNITYYKSQPWSFSDTLLLGFFAELDGDEAITLDKEELALAEWFEREEILVEAGGISLTNEMIQAFKNM